MKDKCKRYATESVFYIIVNILFWLAAIAVSNIVVNSYEKYKYLRIRFVVLIFFIIIAILFYTVRRLKMIKHKHNKLSVLSIFCIENVFMWLTILLNMFFYSIDFHEFAMLSIWIGVVIVFAPIIYVLTIIIYCMALVIKKHKSLKK